MSRRWIVIDPGFEHQDSHHMVVNSQIISACAGDEVLIFSSEKINCNYLGLESKIIPFFSINLYPENYHNLPENEYIKIRGQFFEQLSELFRKIKLSENDCLIIHTAFSFLYEAFARALLKLENRSYSVFISTMFSPGRVVEFGDCITVSIREYMRHKFAFSLFDKLMVERSVKFSIESPTQMYADAYQMIWPNGTVNLHPSVCGGGIKINETSKDKILAYLGGPKWDKGFEFTVEAICSIGNSCPNKEFIFHYNDDFPGAEIYQPLIEKLENSNTPNVTVIRGNLKKEQYEILLASVSCYLMLYDPKDYAYKTSGVLWDTLRHAQGKKIIVSKGSWHEKELTFIGATFAAVEFGNSEDLVTTLRDDRFQPLSSRLYQSNYLQTLFDDFGEHIKKSVAEKSHEVNIIAAPIKKKILVVRTDYGHFTKLSGPGGFVDYLPENGYQVTEILVPLGHENIDFENDSKRWEVLESFTKILKSYQVNSFNVESQILKDFKQYDVIHFVDGEHTGLLVAMAKIKGVLKGGAKIVATFHQPDYVMESLVPKPAFLSAFDTIHLMSPCQREAFLNLGVENEKLIVVPHGVSVEHCKPSISLALAEPAKDEIAAIQGKLEGKKVCLTVGNWLRDYDTFLEVARSFRERDDLYFVAVSRGLKLELTSGDRNILLFNEGLEDRTLHWFYRRAELMFLPLQGGAANNAILEATAAGTPIITTKLPSTDYYTEGDAELCENCKVFIDRIKIAIMSDTGRQSIYDYRFTWPKIALDMVNKLYK